MSVFEHTSVYLSRVHSASLDDTPIHRPNAQYILFQAIRSPHKSSNAPRAMSRYPKQSTSCTQRHGAACHLASQFKAGSSSKTSPSTNASMERWRASKNCAGAAFEENASGDSTALCKCREPPESKPKFASSVDPTRSVRHASRCRMLGAFLGMTCKYGKMFLAGAKSWAKGQHRCQGAR